MWHLAWTSFEQASAQRAVYSRVMIVQVKFPELEGVYMDESCPW